MRTAQRPSSPATMERQQNSGQVQRLAIFFFYLLESLKPRTEATSFETASCQPDFTVFLKSNLCMYGLMSSNGLPSNISRSLTWRILSLTLTNHTRLIPNLLGRCGARVAKIPCCSSDRYGFKRKHVFCDWLK